MDPAHRGGWPPQPGGGGGNTHASSAEQGQPQAAPRPGDSRLSGGAGQQSPPQAPSALPPPPGGPYPAFHPPPPPLASLAGISQSSPRQHPPSVGRPDGPPQGPQLPLPGLSQAIGQPGAAERERERAREVEQIHIKEEEDRRHREQQERQRLEQAPPHQTQPGPPMHLHQPIAVGPRSVHGPNGLLSNPGISGPQPQPQPQMPLGAPSGPGNIFAGGPVQPPAQAQGPGGQQQMQPGLLVPFAPAGQPQPSQQQPMAQQSQSQGQGQQPILNDALSYLDQVKVQFADHPDVYNRFLDIMKDFKSGAIDTPGVIGRVSQLFAGNPELIQGFNTFLPPGYRIECDANNNPNQIRVTTPMGTTIQSIPQPQRPLSRQEGGLDGAPLISDRFTPQPGQQGAPMVFSPSGRPVGPAGPGQQQQQAPQFPSMEAARQQEQQGMHQQDQRGVSSLQNAISAATGGPGMRAGVSPRATPMPGQQDPNAPVDGQQGPPGMEKRGPVEFNHAISYVNKIKNRFSAHPDIYKQFLEILQTYQRESKPIQDVYSQVTHLFKTAPDLLEDFKQFLPESAAHAKAVERARQQAEESAMLSNVRNEGGALYGSPIMSRETHIGTPSHGRGNLPPVGNFAPTPISKDNKRKRGERQGTVGSVADVGGAGAGPSAGKPAYGAQAGGKRVKQTHATATGKGPGGEQPPPASPTLVPRLPTPLPPTTTSAATQEELGFFDRAKKAIGNKNTMNEFLKLCNLFSQDFIDRSTLIHRARAFIGGNPDLMKWFTDFVAYEEKDVIIENKARQPMVPAGRISLSNCRGLGPSYRLLPKRERVKPCSGRDELCNSVLNDEWASHPTWASEDSGFIAHRKNVHEEGLHRIEEERHDYDYNIEACGRTIQLLEPLAQKLRNISDAEQANFKLPHGLGGQSETIYKRVIMKLYGREKGHDVINQLHATPYLVIPVLLNRLKERLETWKLAQREWEKVWREQTQKMFWRSLDHQAVNVRTSDRRQFQTKTLQGEIVLKWEEMREQERKTTVGGGSSMNAGLVKPQLSFEVADKEVVVDAAWLVLVHVDAQGSGTDSPRLGPFIREFVPMFFGMDPMWFEQKLREKMGGTPGNGDGVVPSADEAEGSGRGRKSTKTNLLRQAVDRAGPRSKMGRKDREDSNASQSRASTPDRASNAGEDSGDMAGIETTGGTPAPEDEAAKTMLADPEASRWFNHPATENKLGPRKIDPNEAHKRDVFRLWANTPIYCFVRMFVILYERLHKLKLNEAECRETVKNAQKVKPAMELGIMDKLPSDFFADTGAGANFYAQMLGKFSSVLEGDLDFGNDGVEDCLRRFYLQAGYPLYAFEKMVQALVRYASQVVSLEGGNKEKSWDIVQLWRKDRAKGELVSAVQSTDYRKAVEKLLGVGGEEYAIDWDEQNKVVAISLVKKDGPYSTAEGISALDQENRWRFYIATYSNIEDTDGVDKKELEPVLLVRNMHALGADPKSERFLPVTLPPTDSNSAVEGQHDQLQLPVTTTSTTQEGAAAAAVAAVAGGGEEASVGDRLLARFLTAKNDERLVLRISVNNFHPIFQPGTAEGFIEELPQREGGGDGVKEAEEAKDVRGEGMKDGFLMMNEGMKGLSREVVEGRNEGFGGLVEKGVEEMVGVGGEAEMGERMEVDE